MKLVALERKVSLLKTETFRFELDVFIKSFQKNLSKWTTKERIYLYTAQSNQYKQNNVCILSKSSN